MIEENLPPAPPAPAEARRIVASVMPPLRPETRDDVALMTSEVVSNAVRHGSHDSAQGISLRVDRREHNMRVEVLNDGPSFMPEPRFQPDDERDGGYGLYLVDRLSSAWGVEPEGGRTKVWFEVDDRADA